MTVTWLPRRRQTEPSSRPITPAPMTTRCLGTCGSDSAPVESMMRWLSKGVPLPFGALQNSRSLVALDNLVDLVVTCIGHPAAANEVFLVSDGEDLSTSELLRRLSAALGRPARLLPVPQALIERAAILLGRRQLNQRLCGSLQISMDKTRERLGWTPPLTVDQALAKTAAHYLKEISK